MGGGSGAATDDGRRGCGRGGGGGCGGRTAGAVVAANGGRRGGRGSGRCRRTGRILQQKLLDLEDVDVLVETGTGDGPIVYSRSVAAVTSVGGGGCGSSAQTCKAVQAVARWMVLVSRMVLSNLVVLLLLLMLVMIEMRMVMIMMMVIWRSRNRRTARSDSTRDRFTVQPGTGTAGVYVGSTCTTGGVVIVVQMSRKGTVGGGMAVDSPDGVGRNQVLAMAMADRTGCTTVVDLITFATHSEHFSGRRRDQRSWNRNKQN